MNQTYGTHSDICTRFYDLVYDANHVADFVLEKIKPFSPKEGLFIGGMFLIANQLISQGIKLTLSDYSDEMIDQGKRRLPNANFVRADLKSLPFEYQFDSIFVIGRVFTHMLTDVDATSALHGLYKSLKSGGFVFFDNYEDSKIQKTNYFNGTVIVADAKTNIVRDSTTKLVSTDPMVVDWSARYSSDENGTLTTFEDQMLHRAFAREEINKLVEASGLKLISQGDNFDETSFYTIAAKAL
jgi:ubiquinone/menaquinone biosynthesis C-methylase UbiE